MTEQEKAVRTNNAFTNRRKDSALARVDNSPVRLKQMIDVSVHVIHEEDASQSLAAVLSVRAGMVAGLVYSLVEHVVTVLSTVVENADATSVKEVNLVDLRRQVADVVPTLLSVRELTRHEPVDIDIVQATADVVQALDVLEAVVLDKGKSSSVDESIYELGIAMMYLIRVGGDMKKKVTPEIAEFVRGTLDIVEEKAECAGPLSMGGIVVSRRP